MAPVTSPWLKGKDEVRAYLRGISEHTLEDMMKNGLRPRSSLGGKLNFYHKDDVDKWLVEHSIWQDVPERLKKLCN